MPWTSKAFIFILVVSASAGIDLITQTSITAFMELPSPKETHLDAFLASGTMDGFFNTSEIFGIFNFLAATYPDHIARKSIGRTKGGEDIWAFTVSTSLKSSIRKSEVLFTALHHAREVLSGNMMVKMGLQLIHKCRHGGPHSDFLKYLNVLMIPIVNVDGHRFISNSYGGANWATAKLKRKNTNSDYCP